MYHIVASDMDGTLLAPDHKLSSYTKETLKLLTEKGVNFIFATGRHHIDVRQIRDNLGIKAFMITSNGARVHDMDNQLIYSQNVDATIAKELYQLVADHENVETHVYKSDQWYTNKPCRDAEEFHEESGFNYEIFDTNELSGDDVCKIFYCSDDYDLLLTLERDINAQYGEQVNASFSTVSCLEVMAGSVSKGNALAFVASLLGHDLDDCIAFGDGMNDVEMLNMAAKGCVMGNAPQRVKDTLSELEVIGANKDDAVARYLRTLYHV